MIIRCTKCSTEFALDPNQVGPEGVTLRCSVCSHMFHAEPVPGPEPAPWRVMTADRSSFVVPDLRRLLEQIEDGRVSPDDQVSRTGDTWIRLGEMPEFSSLFIGAEGLPRVFRAVESSPAGDLGPPPAFGAGVDEVRREESVRFNLSSIASGPGGSGLRRPPPHPSHPSQVVTRSGSFAAVPGSRHGHGHGHGHGADSLPAPPEFDAGLPAPPDFDTPVSRRGRGDPRSFPTVGSEQGAPASMLEAVTKAVAAGEERRLAATDSPLHESSHTRSQPILIADLARAAAASAEKAVQAVDGQRRRAERSTGTFTGSMSRVDPARPESSAGIHVRDARSGTRPLTREMPTVSARDPMPREGGRRETADLKLATAAARAVELRMSSLNMGNPESEPTQVLQPNAALDEPAGSDAPEFGRTPEVVVVKMPDSRRGTSPVLWGLLGAVAAAAIVFGVPSLRERVWNLGGPSPTTGGAGNDAAVAAADTTPAELEQARKAIRNLGFKESNKVQAALQRVIDDPSRSPQANAQARLTQAELVLMRALACKIAVTIEPAAMGGRAQTRSVEDPVQAQELLASVRSLRSGTNSDVVDADQLRRIEGLQALVEGRATGELPANSDELAALIKAAPMWRGEMRTPPAGLITSLQRLAAPSTLAQSVLALALWRSGDIDGARALLRTIVARVSDQPAARTMLEALDRQDMLAENGDPEAAVPPSEPEPEPVVEPEPVEPDAKVVEPDAKVETPEVGATPGGRPGPGPAQERVEVLISTGCQKVRQGDALGVKLLLDAVDRGADPMQNFNLCFCLGAGFARQNSHDAALTWYKRAAQQSPNNRDAVAGAARSAELLGRTNTAVEYYRKLRTLEPGNAAAAVFLAKHDPSREPTAPTDEPPGDLMPIKPKLK